MADLEFHYAKETVYPGWAHRVCRTAIMSPFGLLRKARPLFESHRLLQKGYRDALVRLRDADWKVLQDTGSLGQARNCPPFGVLPSRHPNIRTCKRERVCPNCYARGVVFQCCHSLRWAIEQLGEEPQVKLVVVRTETAYDDAESACLAVPGRVNDDVAAYPKSKLAGSRTYINAAPTAGRDSAGVVSQLTSFMLVGKSVPDPVWVSDAAEVRVIEVPDLPAMADAVGWGLRYPAGMLTGNPVTAVALLHGLAGKRLAGSDGLCRNEWVRDLVRKFRAASKTGGNHEDEDPG